VPPRLRTEIELDSAFAVEEFLIFKHSTRCGISAAAFEEYRRWSDAHPAALSGWIDVIEDRPLARAVAERTGISHQSPQAILLDRGTARWSASHGEITEESLSGAVVPPER